MALSQPHGGWQRLIERCVDGLDARWSAALPAPSVDLSALVRGPAGKLLGRYLDLVLQWNARVDLTAARDAEELVDLFIADAAILASVADQAGHWLDVGSGAGAPGLPLKLLRPDLQISLVEPKTKRVSFLRTVVSSLGLALIEVKRMRSEEVEDRACGVALSRATFSPDAWLAEGARLSRGAVWVLLAQGDAPAQPGWQADLEVAYRWPLSSVSRRAVRYVSAE